MRSAARHSDRRARVGVLQVVLSLAPGGTERLVIETVRRLRGRYRMTVCCLDGDGAWADELRLEGVEVVALGRRAGFRPSLGRAIADLAARHGAGVLHCHHYSPFIYGCVARAFNPRLRVVFTEHGRFNEGPPSRKRRLANRLFSMFPHRVCAVSSDLGRHMAVEGFDLDAIEVVANGIEPGAVPDEPARQRARALLGLDDDTFVVGTVGRLDPVKDVPTLIDAFRQFSGSRPTARLVIVGDGPLRSYLEGLARGVTGIQFTGHRADVRQLMAAFDAYVSSSIFEGMSLTILEAMAAARPIVATRAGGTPEIVVDGVTGLLVQPGDGAGLADALSQLGADPARARAMGAAGRDRVCERFTLERMVTHYAEAYAQLGAS